MSKFEEMCKMVLNEDMEEGLGEETPIEKMDDDMEPEDKSEIDTSDTDFIAQAESIKARMGNLPGSLNIKDLAELLRVKHDLELAEIEGEEAAPESLIRQSDEEDFESIREPLSIHKRQSSEENEEFETPELDD